MDGLTRSAIDERHLERALELAERAAKSGQAPFGAVVVGADGGVLGEGHNCVLRDRDPSAHGEIAAIRDAWARAGSSAPLVGATLYTSCEPCLMCSYAIVDVGIARVVFGASGADVPGHRAFLGGGLELVAEWLSGQEGWNAIEVVPGVLRARAVEQLGRHVREDSR